MKSWAVRTFFPESYTGPLSATPTLCAACCKEEKQVWCWLEALRRIAVVRRKEALWLACWPGTDLDDVQATVALEHFRACIAIHNLGPLVQEGALIFRFSHWASWWWQGKGTLLSLAHHGELAGWMENKETYKERWLAIGFTLPVKGGYFLKLREEPSNLK